MQLHSGEHILSGVVHRRFGYENVGFHMGADFVTIDFSGMLTPERVVQPSSAEANEVGLEKPFRSEIAYPDAEALKTDPLPQQEGADRAGAHRDDSRRGYLRLLRYACVQYR